MHFGFPTSVEARSPPVNLDCSTQTMDGGGGSHIKKGARLAPDEAYRYSPRLFQGLRSSVAAFADNAVRCSDDSGILNLP